MAIIPLILNLSLLVAISVVSGFIEKFSHNKTPIRSIINGLLFGLAAIIGMLNPLEFEGIFFDGRSVIISVCTLFFGPLAGIISAAIPFALRVNIGGPGIYMGTLSILSSFFIGWAYHQRFLKRANDTIPHYQLYNMGLIVHIALILLIFFLPQNLWITTFKEMGVAIMVFYPIATLLMGRIVSDQVSNRRLIEEIKESERYFRSAFYSISDAILTTDSKGRIKRTNAVVEQLTGLTAAEMRGKAAKDIIPLFDEKKESIDSHLLTAFLKNKSEEERKPTYLRHISGQYVPVCLRISPLRSEKKHNRGAVVVIRNRQPELDRQIELMKSADSYRNFFNNFGGAAFIQDVESKFIDVNDEAMRLYGYPKSFFIGKTQEVLTAIGYNDNEKINNYITDAIEGKNSVFEFWGKRADHSIFPSEMHLLGTIYNDQPAVLAIGYDISERKKAENDLRLAFERYQALFEVSPVAMALKTMDDILIEVNDVMCKDMEYRRDELIGRHVSVFRLEKYHLEAETSLQIENDKINSRLASAKTKSGEKRIFLINETNLRLPDGQQAVLAIAMNVTKQIEIEKAMRQSKSRNKAILSAIPDTFFRLSNEGVALDYLANDFNKIRLIPADIIGKNILEYVPELLRNPFQEFIQNTTSSDLMQSAEFKLELQGSTNWFEVRLINSGNHEVLVFMRDITDRKLSELEINRQKRLIETLIESIPNPLFYMNKDGEFLGINKAFKDLYGIEPGEIIGKNLYHIESEMNARSYQQDDQRIFSGLDQFQAFERTITLPNGKKIEAIISKSPLPGYGTEIAGLVGIITDITALKHLENELIKAKEKAEESDLLKTSFLNNMNHEIRTPLNAIVGFSELLFDDFSDEEKRSFVNTINNNAEQLLHIIDEVLLISRFDAGNHLLEIERTNIAALLSEISMSHKTACAAKKINLTLDLPDENLELMIDKAKVRQVMTGLVENAIKYTQTGSICIGASYADKSLRLFVRDTGLGVPENEQEHIFKRFYRGQKGQKMAVRGNGLGLSIAQRIVEVMHGTIGLISQEEKGSEFFITLQANELDAQLNQQEAENWLLADFGRYRLLVVDDEIDNALFLSSALEKYFAEIAIANTALQSLDLQRAKPFDIVLMDIKMPGMNGDEATKLLLKEFPDTIVIGQTAYSQPEELKRMILAGAKTCLTKPLSLKKILDEIYNQLILSGKL